MADNFQVTSGSGTTVATKDASGVHHPKQLVEFDVGGTPTLVSSSNPLPISDAGASITVDGAVAINAALPAGSNTLGGVKITDGTNTASVRDCGTNDALNVAIVDASGNQITSFGGGGGSGGSSIVDDAAFTVGTSNLTAVGGTYKSVRDAVDDNDAGAFAMTAKRAQYVTLETPNGDSAMDEGNDAIRANIVTASAIPVTDNGGSLTVDNAGTFAVQATLAAGASNIAKAEDAASADADVGVPAMAVRKATPANTSGTDGDYEMLQISAGRLWTSSVIDTALPSGSNAIGKLAANSGVNIGNVGLAPATSGGLSIYRSLSVVATGQAVKTSAGQLYGFYFFNAATATRYLKVYDKSSAATVGTDTPVMTFPLPAGSGALVEFTNGIAFASGISIGATTALADNSTSAPAANEVIVNLLYK